MALVGLVATAAKVTRRAPGRIAGRADANSFGIRCHGRTVLKL